MRLVLGSKHVLNFQCPSLDEHLSMDTFFEKRKNLKMPKYGQNAQVWTVSEKNGCPHLGTGTVFLMTNFCQTAKTNIKLQC